MMADAKNGTVMIDDTDMDYITFGKGKRIFVIIPGLGDGLRTVKGTAIAFAWAYRKLCSDFKVYVFSRKNKLPEGYTTRDMARDLVTVMKKLGIYQVDVMGISQGGMIAQYVAIDYPEMVRNLILTVTLSRQNHQEQLVARRWIKMAKADNYKGIITETAELSYSEKYLKKYRLLYPVLGILGKPKDFRRFVIQAESCLQHDAFDELKKIQSPTLVIGGECDHIVGGDASRELAATIRNSELYMYPSLSHGLYDEAKDFQTRIIAFLNKEPREHI